MTAASSSRRATRSEVGLPARWRVVLGRAKATRPYALFTAIACWLRESPIWTVGMIRGRVLALLEEQERFSFTGGSKLAMYTQYLRDVGRSRVCIDVPGVGPLSYRLVAYLAVGSCIVSYPHDAQLHVPLVDRKHVVYVKKDLSDLVDLCDHYVNNPGERRELAENAREYFDKYLHRDQLAAYHLHSVLERLPDK